VCAWTGGESSNGRRGRGCVAFDALPLALLRLLPRLLLLHEQLLLLLPLLHLRVPRQRTAQTAAPLHSARMR
jgi:hypothetical protein